MKKAVLVVLVLLLFLAAAVGWLFLTPLGRSEMHCTQYWNSTLLRQECVGKDLLQRAIATHNPALCAKVTDARAQEYCRAAAGNA